MIQYITFYDIKYDKYSYYMLNCGDRFHIPLAIYHQSVHIFILDHKLHRIEFYMRNSYEALVNLY